MKKKISGIVIPLFVSMLFGFVCAKLLYKVYNDEIENKLSSSKLYLVQNGQYLSYDSMREENMGNNYVYYKDDDGYKTIVGITKSVDNVSKIKKLYNDMVTVSEYYISNELLNNKQNEYDMELASVSDIHQVKEVVDNILNLYRKEDTIRLILVK